MNILGIGFPEFLFIFVIALIVVGPKNLITSSKKFSGVIQKIVTSNTWKSVIYSTQEIKDLKEKIIEDTGLNETLRSFQDSTRILISPSTKEMNSLDIMDISPCE